MVNPIPALALACALTFGAALGDTAVCNIDQTTIETPFSSDRAGVFESLISEADSAATAGRMSQAAIMLTQAAGLAETSGTPHQCTLALGRLSDACLLLRHPTAALQYAQKSVSAARLSGDGSSLARALNYLGNAMFSRGDYPNALSTYIQAGAAAAEIADAELINIALANRLHSLLAMDLITEARKILLQESAAVGIASAYPGQALDLLSLAHLAATTASRIPAGDANLTDLAHGWYQQALALDETKTDPRLWSLGFGYLGELYESRHRPKEAERLYRRALFFAAQQAFADLQARWHWRLGRIHRARGKPREAIAELQQAVSHAESVLPALIYGTRGHAQTFYRFSTDLYRELADLLLVQAAGSDDQGQSQQKLRTVRDLMERLKQTELRAYFRDSCLRPDRGETETDVEQLLTPGTAVLYPVILPQRLVILLSTAASGIKVIELQAASREIEQAVDRFHLAMTSRGSAREARSLGQRLYRWLIAPLEQSLKEQSIHTLVVVPDGLLRTLPFAALHDGNGWLIERYAIAVSPGLKLTGRSAATPPRRALLGGAPLVQGRSALPFSEAELRAAMQWIPGTPLLGPDFTEPRLRRELASGDYDLAVLSAHGEFSGEHGDSFLHTSSGRLALDELERMLLSAPKPPDLLVLNACETAAGDERAALGLAGMASRSGVASVLGALWRTSDIASALLVPDFLRELSAGGVSRAEALRRAQLRLISSQRHRHPAQWAPFVLVGQWI